MGKYKEKITLSLLVAVYLLTAFRYYPGRWRDSLVETAAHFLVAAPFTIGATILIVVVLQRMGDGRLPWDRVLRIFLGLAITFEFFFGLYNYLAIHQVPVTP